jgi:hypothetical protein
MALLLLSLLCALLVVSVLTAAWAHEACSTAKGHKHQHTQHLRWCHFLAHRPAPSPLLLLLLLLLHVQVVAVLTAALAGEGSRKTKDRKLPSRSTSSGAVDSIARTSPPLAAAAAAVIPVTEQQQQDKSANGRHSCEGRAHPTGVPQVSPTGHSPSSIHAPAPPSTGCGCVIC